MTFDLESRRRAAALAVLARNRRLRLAAADQWAASTSAVPARTGPAVPGSRPPAPGADGHGGVA